MPKVHKVPKVGSWKPEENFGLLTSGSFYISNIF